MWYKVQCKCNISHVLGYECMFWVHVIFVNAWKRINRPGKWIYRLWDCKRLCFVKWNVINMCKLECSLNDDMNVGKMEWNSTMCYACRWLNYRNELCDTQMHEWAGKWYVFLYINVWMHYSSVVQRVSYRVSVNQTYMPYHSVS